MNELDIIDPRIVPDTVVAPTEQPPAIPRTEHVNDRADDLLDPQNPGHDAWAREHPSMGNAFEQSGEQGDE